MARKQKPAAETDKAVEETAVEEAAVEDAAVEGGVEESAADHSVVDNAGAEAEATDAEAVDTATEVVEDPLAAMTRERDDLNDRLMRLAAEFDNFRKRTAREYQEQRKRAASDVLREMIELVDNFERALEAPAEDAAGLRKGVEMIHQQLVASLGKFGIESIEAEGQAFDPQQHEALMMVESDEVESQHVVQVIQKGYALNGEILRPARVTVSK